MDITIITNLGWQATAKVNAGTDNITYTKIVFSSDDYSSSNDTDVAKITSLTNQEISAQAQSYVLNDGTIKVRANADNKNLQNPFSVKTYALYAHLNNNQEFIFAIMVSGTADYYPAFDGKNVNELSDSFKFKFSNTDHISITDSSEVGISKQDLDSMGLAKQSDLKDMQTTINQSISGPDSTVSKNIAQAKTDANTYTDSVKDSLQHGIDTTNHRVDTVHDQIGGDIASAKSELNGQIGELSDKSLKFIRELTSKDDINDESLQDGMYRWYFDVPQNAPNYLDCLLVVSHAGFCSLQTLISTYDASGNENRVLNRCNANHVWSSWTISATTDDTAALSTRLDKAQDQLGADIRDAEQRAKDDADKKIQFFDNETDAHNANLPFGTLKIVRG